MRAVNVLYVMASTIYGHSTPDNKCKFNKTYTADLTLELMRAIKVGDLSKVQNLIALGVDVNKPYAFEEATLSPLVVAILKEEFEIVCYLIEHGANVNAEYNFAGMRAVPLVAAVHQNNLKIVSYLVDHGANINAISKIGYSTSSTILHDAVVSGNMLIVQYLVEHGANVNAISMYEGSPCSVLYTAITHANLSIVNYLAEHGADVNARCKDESPLDLSIRIDDILIVKCLVEHGADINSLNTCGSTALDIAYNQEIINYLKSNGAKSIKYPDDETSELDI
jgi:ankyrin repeat protein